VSFVLLLTCLFLYHFILCHLVACVRILLSPYPLLFPYTTLFRSYSANGSMWTPSKWSNSNPWSSTCSSKNKSKTTDSHSTASTRSHEHTSALQSRFDLVCRLLHVKKEDNVLCPRWLQCAGAVGIT